ncbi:hypothetical protein BDR26DRAFT_875732 [Obelidium mucronatum]|nr:hypothetical protein BDR26DRAFT_875732 [Obelidium mucronatum]
MTSMTSLALPPGYSFQIFKNRDWSDLTANVLSYVAAASSVGDCAGLAFSFNASFFTFNGASNECWPKQPGRNDGTQTIVPYPPGTGTYYMLPDLDFYKMFEIPNAAYDDATDSTDSCYKRCVKTDGCVIAAFKANTHCVLKGPDVLGVTNSPGYGASSSDPEAQKVAGVIYPPTSSSSKLFENENLPTTPSVGVIVGVSISVLFIVLGAAAGLYYTRFENRSERPSETTEPAATENTNTNTSADTVFIQSKTDSDSNVVTVLAEPRPSEKEPVNEKLFANMEMAMARGSGTPVTRLFKSESVSNFPIDVNMWSVDNASCWISKNGGGVDGANRAVIQKINGRGLLILDVSEILSIVQCEAAGDRVLLQDALLDLRNNGNNSQFPPAYDAAQ